MIRIIKSEANLIEELEQIEAGAWIALTSPSQDELEWVSENLSVEIEDLKAALDDNERSHIEIEDNYTLILVDIPIIEERNEKQWYGTIPMGIIVTKENIITVCLNDTPVLTGLMKGKVKNFYTGWKTRFILQILYRNAALFLQYLRGINKRTEIIEKRLQQSPQNKEIIQLLELEKSLVYFTTSLRSNEMVLEKLMKIETIKKYPEDTELLEDVIIENKQAIEMVHIYSGIINSMMDAVSSVINNNVNNVMKVLAIITIVLSVPTMIFSAYGMNVNGAGMPFASEPWGFIAVIGMSILMAVIVAIVFLKSKILK
ncbi:MAG: magnesium transporter CorA family protein [Ruminococcaceae bacterium]|nr:magnesium transporter CorA family protein [Oscillospiraceae bacterium]